MVRLGLVLGISGCVQDEPFNGVSFESVSLEWTQGDLPPRTQSFVLRTLTAEVPPGPGCGGALFHYAYDGAFVSFPLTDDVRLGTVDGPEKPLSWLTQDGWHWASDGTVQWSRSAESLQMDFTGELCTTTGCAEGSLTYRTPNGPVSTETFADVRPSRFTAGSQPLCELSAL